MRTNRCANPICGDDAMKPAVLAFVLVSLIVARPRAVREFYVAPSGSPRNAGTADSPWDLRTALANARGLVQPGDTVFLLDGTYRGRFYVRVSGAVGAAVKFRALPFSAPRLDGNSTVRTTAPIPKRATNERVSVRLASYADSRDGGSFYVVYGGRVQEVVETSLEDGRIVGTRRCPLEPAD